MRRKQFQLPSFPCSLNTSTLFSHSPAQIRSAPPNSTASLARTADRSHRLYQRPVGVILTVLAALMRSKTSDREFVISCAWLKRAGLHYIAFSELTMQRQDLSRFRHQKSQNLLFRDELGLRVAHLKNPGRAGICPPARSTSRLPLGRHRHRTTSQNVMHLRHPAPRNPAKWNYTLSPNL